MASEMIDITRDMIEIDWVDDDDGDDMMNVVLMMMMMMMIRKMIS